MILPLMTGVGNAPQTLIIFVHKPCDTKGWIWTSRCWATAALWQRQDGVGSGIFRDRYFLFFWAGAVLDFR